MEMEVHTITYEKAPLQRYFAGQMGLLAGCLAALLGAAVALCLAVGTLFAGVLCGILLSAAYSAGRILLRLISLRKRMLKDYPDTTVTASLYEDRLVLRSVCRGIPKWERHIPLDGMEKIKKDSSYYHLYYGGKTYLIPLTAFQKGENDPGSRLETLLEQHAAKGKRKPPAKR